MGAQVARHDDDRVLEVDDAALAVRQAAVIEDLQKYVENIGMGLFDFVEENDTVRSAPYGFGELTAFIVADVSRRRPDKAGDRVLFHIFAHVDADDVPFIVKKRFGEGFSQFRLADACRAEEDERADRAVRIFYARAGADDRIADDLYRFILTDDPFMKRIVQVEKLFPFTGHHLCHGNARPTADDLGNVFFAHFLLEKVAVASLGERFFLFGQLLL